MADHYWRKYGAGATLDFELYSTNGVDLKSDATFAAGDVKIMKDEGAEVNIASLPTDEGQGYSIPLSAAEATAAQVVVYIVDQTSPKAWMDKVLIIDTYGNASAQHALDLDDSVRAGLTALPNAAADAAGGLVISDVGGQDVDTIFGRITGNVALASIATEARLAELNAANLPADIDTLLTRLSAVRAGYLDELAAANIPADVDILLGRLTAVRAGYLDALNGHIAQTGDSFARLGAPAGVSIAADLVTITAYIDGEIADILVDTNEIQGLISASKINAQVKGIDADVITASALNADAVDEIHDEVIEGAITFRQVMRILLAFMSGVTTGGGTATIDFRDIADTKDRLSFTVDVNNNRTVVGTRDGT